MSEPNEISSRLPATGAAELIQARVSLLHSLGREAVDCWEAAGQPLPVPELATIAIRHTTEL